MIFQEDTVYSIPDIHILPLYPGGRAALSAFVRYNLQYPKDFNKQSRKKANKKKGEKSYEEIIYISFILEKDGSITNVRVLQGFIDEMDKEAVRVIEIMSIWTPGYVNSKPVRTRLTLPIRLVV